MYCSPQFLCPRTTQFKLMTRNLLGHYIPGLVGEGILSESDEEFLRNLFPVEVT